MISEAPATDPTAALLDEILDDMRRGEAPDVDRLAAEHPDHADEIRQLVAVVRFVHEAAQKFDPAADLAARIELGREKPVLGDFRLVREIGRGGMGVVYEARQISLDRRVAVKVLLPGVSVSRRAIERFGAEARTAGQLHHSHIVPVFAVGEHESIPYYAMQYIEGSSLAQFTHRLRDAPSGADEAHWRTVALWGRQVAGALGYAHGRGIIHRDVKPSNVLLDRDGNVWVTDFGLARRDTQASLTLSDDLLGTVRYMSPEQARGNEVDERSDVYSLGATLYEVAGLRPACDGESREAALKQVLFDAPRPLSRVNPAIPRGLVVIIHKALAKEPARRYQSAGALAEDLRRFLAGEPLIAQPPRAIEQLGRLIRRHTGLFVLAALLFASLAVFAAAMTVQSVRIARRHDQAQRVSTFLQSILSYASPTAASSESNPALVGHDLTMREVLDLAAERVAGELADDPEVEAEVRWAIGQAYWQMGRLGRAQANLTRSVELRRRLLGDADPDVVRDAVALATLMRVRDEAVASEALLRSILDALGPDHTGRPAALDALGHALAWQDRSDEGESLVLEALELRRARYGETHPEVAESLISLASLSWDRGDLTSSVEFTRRALAVRRRLYDGADERVIDPMTGLGSYLTLRGRPEDLPEAAAVLRDALRRLGDRRRTVRYAATQSLLAGALAAAGRDAEAERLYVDAIETKRTLLGDDHPEVAQTLFNYGGFLASRERLDEARGTLTDAMEIRRRTYGDDHALTREVVASLEQLQPVVR